MERRGCAAEEEEEGAALGVTGSAAGLRVSFEALRLVLAVVGAEGVGLLFGVEVEAPLSVSSESSESSSESSSEDSSSESSSQEISSSAVGVDAVWGFGLAMGVFCGKGGNGGGFANLSAFLVGVVLRFQ